MRTELTALRAAMAAAGVDWYYVPTADFHASEYTGEYFKCRRYLSSFTGSAGVLLVGKDWAGLWTDGRYFLQAADQLKDTGIDLMKSGQPGVPSITEYLKQNLTAGQTLGFDGRTLCVTEYRYFRKTAEGNGAKLRGDLDLAGDVWADRPARSAEPAYELPLSLTGKSRADKLAETRAVLKKRGADVLVLASLMDICWLLNIRGNDVAYTPVVLSFAVLTADEAMLFAAPEAFDDSLRAALAADGVTLRGYDEIYDYVKTVPAGKTLMMNPGAVNSAILNAIPEGVKVLESADPTNLPKGIKNPVEAENFRIAHIKDGAAVTKLMYWLHLNAGRLPMTEISVAKKLDELRAEQEGSLGRSFDYIIGYAQHGAIVHYSATEESNAKVEARSFLLADTGGHYTEGTTDITRTFVMGPLTEEEKRIYTLVLKSHLTLYGLKFPKGMTGQMLDAAIRMPLWQAGLDYNHGTGHGVGFRLSVHEGPQSISWSRAAAGTPLEPGMVTSNEPGLYLEGKFGVRHENLMLCVEKGTDEFHTWYGFENLTLVPFERDAILPELLTDIERKHLNEYHKRVRETLLPYMTADEGKWLAEATVEI